MLSTKTTPKTVGELTSRLRSVSSTKKIEVVEVLSPQDRTDLNKALDRWLKGTDPVSVIILK